MITDYKRPNTLEEALILLREKSINPWVLSGGSYPDETKNGMNTAIDFQVLGFNQINIVGDRVEVGGSASLQQLHDHSTCPLAMRQAIQLEGGRNVRNSYSLHSHVMTSKGRSALTTVLLALDTTIEILPESVSMNLNDFLIQRSDYPSGIFISKIVWSGSTVVAFESIARTPLDQPIICVSVAKWLNGRVRIAFGGYGDVPRITFDGSNMADIEFAVQSATSGSGDEWASEEYRQEMAKVLCARCLNVLAKQADEGEV
jgi:CO/xanthine dehydrogenase FAD-binding subunit